MQAGEAAVAVELAQLRGEIGTGLAEIKGSLGVLVERSDRATKDIEDLEGRVSSLERKVWMAAGIAAVVSGGGAAGLFAALGG
jgi:hypothetical protein